MSDSKLHKLGRLYASLSTEYPKEELANLLGIPTPDKRQRDLQYMSAIFVSSGFNLNAAYFLPSELILAQDTIVDKALDIEHDEERVVGHLFSKVFTHKDGSVFDPEELQENVGMAIEKVPMDIVTAARIYKARFPEVALDVANGRYGVSMECFYKDFDIIVDDIIVPKMEATALGLTKVVNNVVKVVEGAASKGEHRVGRVLRGILFSGCGLVEKPANPDSVILETAALNNDYILDLTKIDSYMQAKQDKESIVIHSLDGAEKDLAYISASYGGSHRHMEVSSDGEGADDGSHTHLVLPDDVPGKSRVYFVEDGAHNHEINLDDGSVKLESAHTHKVYVSEGGKFYTVDSSEALSQHYHQTSALNGDIVCGPSYGGAHYHSVDIGNDVEVKTIMPSDILNGGAAEMVKEDKKEGAGTGNVDGRPLSDPDTCVSFKRYVYARGPGDDGDTGVPPRIDATPGLNERVESYPAPAGGTAPGGNVTQQDKIIHENWCALFDAACPTPGGLATHPECLRLVLNRTTKDTISNYYEQLQENRAKVGVKSALASLVETVEKAKKLY